MSNSAVAGEQALVDHRVFELLRDGKRAVVDLDAERDVARNVQDDVERRGCPVRCMAGCRA